MLPGGGDRKRQVGFKQGRDGVVLLAEIPLANFHSCNMFLSTGLHSPVRALPDDVVLGVDRWPPHHRVDWWSFVKSGFLPKLRPYISFSVHQQKIRIPAARDITVALAPIGQVEH